MIEINTSGVISPFAVQIDHKREFVLRQPEFSYTTAGGYQAMEILVVLFLITKINFVCAQTIIKLSGGILVYHKSEAPGTKCSWA